MIYFIINSTDNGEMLSPKHPVFISLLFILIALLVINIIPTSGPFFLYQVIHSSPCYYLRWKGTQDHMRDKMPETIQDTNINDLALCKP